MAQEWRSPLASSAPILPLAGSTWTAVMTNNPSCIEPGNSLSHVDQDEWPSPFVLNSSGFLSSAKSERDPYITRDRHQKVLLSNLGLTVFVRHLVKQVS
jgi:hypothetical protein